MTIMREFIRRAYRRIGVVASDEPMTADQLDVGMQEFASLLRAWDGWGIKSAPVDITAESAFPMADAFEDHAGTILASRLAEMNGLPGPDRREAENRMLNMAMETPKAEIPLALRRTDPVRRFWSGY
jgi:hypothetical protein